MAEHDLLEKQGLAKDVIMSRGRRQRAIPSDEEESEPESQIPQRNDGHYSDAYDEEEEMVGALAEQDLREELARKLVRYALSCEYGRKPIKRQDINHKILETHSRQFNKVFMVAQLMLRTTFGMEMVELPKQERLTPAQRRAAASKSDKPVSSSTGNYVLRSTLEAKYRTALIITPPRVPTVFEESSYVGLYSFMISVIYISGGSIPEETFHRHLRRVNADTNTPIDGTEKLIQRMVSEGYLTRTKDNSAGDELVEYHVGPRGRVEVGEHGVSELVKAVYGDARDEELLKKLERTLSLNFSKSEISATGGGDTEVRKRKRTARSQPRGGDEDDEGEQIIEDDDDSDDDE